MTWDLLRKMFTVSILAIFGLGVTACNTSDGVSRDTEEIGESVEDAADDTGDALEDAGDDLEDAVD